MRPPMLYEYTDIPEGMTFAAHRRSRRPARRRWLAWLSGRRRAEVRS